MRRDCASIGGTRARSTCRPFATPLAQKRREGLVAKANGNVERGLALRRPRTQVRAAVEQERRLGDEMPVSLGFVRRSHEILQRRPAALVA